MNLINVIANELADNRDAIANRDWMTDTHEDNQSLRRCTTIECLFVGIKKFYDADYSSGAVYFEELVNSSPTFKRLFGDKSPPWNILPDVYRLQLAQQIANVEDKLGGEGISGALGL